MINKDAIKNYLARDLGNYDWLKRLPTDKLDAELRMLRPRPQFNGVKLWDHQKASLLLALELKRFMFFLDMGGGKTLLSLSLIYYLKQRGEKPKAIVFVPYLTSVETWIEEVAKHMPDLKCVPLLGSTVENEEKLNSEGDLFVICYQSAVAMLSISKTGYKGKYRWSIEAKQVRDCFAGFNVLILDEVHRCKNPNSLTYRMCRAISSTSEYVLGLTGTPFGNDLMDLWPEFYLIDFGETLGPTLSLYRSVFFSSKAGYWGGQEYTFKKRLMPDLTRLIKNRSIRYSIDEFYDMPPKEYCRRSLALPPAASGYVERALADLKEAVKGGSYRAAENSYLQLRQLSSGFMTLYGEDNDKLEVAFDENPKLDALEEILLSVPVHSRVVVFHHFRYTSSIISKQLHSLKIAHSIIHGGVASPIDQLRTFKQDPKCRVLVINWKSGSSSLNLQGANYMIVYEQPDSPIDRKQGEARLWRPGQQQRVFIYDLLVRGTVDERMHAANLAGKRLLDQLLEGVPDEMGS